VQYLHWWRFLTRACREGIAPYFNKHQCLDESDNVHPDPQFMPYAAKDKHHGRDGPIHTSFNDYYEVYKFPSRERQELT
jgi:hypothetical protein